MCSPLKWEQKKQVQFSSVVNSSYRIIHTSEEVNLILKGIYLALQLNLVYVGCINILKENGRMWSQSDK